ncbi:cytochrome P450 3A40-like [Solea solea]|uniref:cytochrome P450 3A40-like n=1 Tax=Solea solea TaxID=90069 RepID=UPI00272D22AD|nr:cytochrome P450 3A40-like [Solea solea]
MGFLPFFLVETWILLITFICLFVMYGKWSHGVFEKMGIPGPKPLMYLGSVCQHNNVYYLDDNECAKKYGRVWGTFELRCPLLAVMDPDMLKVILVKECFTYFINRRNLKLNGDLNDALVFSEDDHWRRVRNLLTPSFTSGRLKEMFSIMKHHSRKMTDCLQSKVDNNDVISIQDFFGPYSLDVMASCVLSVDIDSLNNPNCSMMRHAKNIFKISMPVFLFQGCFPFFVPLLEMIGVSLFCKESIAFFKMIVKKIRAERNGSSHQTSRDILQQMIKSQTMKESNNQAGLNDHEITSQVTMFAFAGFETTANTLYFLAYLLARTPEVMTRLQKEVDSTFPNKGSVEYEALMQMEYLDAVVSECLRLYPPIARLDRKAKETVVIKGITIPKDMGLMVPVYALHRDPELWPEPEEFRPDRFSKENKQNIHPYAYLPFGTGPRNCLGMRFGLVIVKLALAEVLQNYSFSVCEETEIPLQMNPESFVAPLRPIKLKMLVRSTT